LEEDWVWEGKKGGLGGVVIFWEYTGEIAGVLTLIGALPLAAWACPGVSIHK